MINQFFKRKAVLLHMTAEIIFDANWPGEFSERLKTDGPWSNWEMYKLSAEVQQTLAIPEFEGLRACLLYTS
ncbi:ATP-dependent helicase, partial [Bacillus velezensis]